MNEIFASTPFILLLVLGSYLVGCKLYRKKHFALFHPLLVAMILIIAILLLLDIDYDTFCAGSSFISFNPLSAFIRKTTAVARTLFGFSTSSDRSNQLSLISKSP